jgi:hypothetical protein
LRLLLDAHVSARRIGTALEDRGHDVLSVADERDLDGYTDEQIMELASDQQRVLVTFDAADFPRICRDWAETDRSHWGCAVVVGIRQHEFGAAVRALEATFSMRPDPGDWRDYLAFVSRV